MREKEKEKKMSDSVSKEAGSSIKDVQGKKRKKQSKKTMSDPESESKAGRLLHPEDEFFDEEKSHELLDVENSDELADDIFVKVECHGNCNMCAYKLQGSLSNPDYRIVDSEFVSPNGISAFAAVNATESEVINEMSYRLPGKKVKVTITQADCGVAKDKPGALEFNEQEFRTFLKSYVGRVENSLDKKWGPLYKGTYTTVFKLYSKASEEDEPVHGTAFLICKTLILIEDGRYPSLRSDGYHLVSQNAQLEERTKHMGCPQPVPLIRFVSSITRLSDRPVTSKTNCLQRQR